MSTCQQCGISGAPSQIACATCATANAGARPSAKPEADVSALWRIRFDLVEKAGGPSRPLLKQLRLGERFRLLFNLWAFLFGVFYYLAKGMWRKAIAMTLVAVCATVVVNLVFPEGDSGSVKFALNGAMAAWFSIQANVSYYKKVVLGDNGWW